MEIENSNDNFITNSQSDQNIFKDFNLDENILEEQLSQSYQQQIQLSSEQIFSKKQDLIDTQSSLVNDSITQQKEQSIQVKKKVKQKQKQVNVLNIYQSSIPLNSLKISSGFSISNDGIIRFCYILGQISFGYSQQQVQRIDYKKGYDIIETYLTDESVIPKLPIEQALKYITHIPQIKFEEISSLFNEFNLMKKIMKVTLDGLNFNQQTFVEQDIEMMKHIKSCNEFIQQYSIKNEGQMYSYSIGRYNLKEQDFEMVKYGYSKSFLDFLGVDVENFCQILLRNQRIDLIKSKEEVQKQSLLGLQLGVFSNQEPVYTTYIETFDGFPIKLYIKKVHLEPTYKPKKFSPYYFEYILSFTEFDVDLFDLQNLISYRQRLCSVQQIQNFDDFIKKELSYLFENVEYSVHSQSLIEKYYNDNLQKLYSIQQQKLQQVQDSSKYCGYRIINKVNNNHLQIIQSK